MAMLFVGHDWAEAHHDVDLEDDQGTRLAKARLREGVEGVARFHELVAPFVEDPAEVVVATETERGLFVGALVAAGYTVLAVNPSPPRAAGSDTRPRERSPTWSTPGHWPSWPAPTATITERSPATVSWRGR